MLALGGLAEGGERADRDRAVTDRLRVIGDALGEPGIASAGAPVIERGAVPRSMLPAEDELPEHPAEPPAPEPAPKRGLLARLIGR